MQKGISDTVVSWATIIRTQFVNGDFSIEFQGIILITDENFATCGQYKIQNF